jgi:RNA polymerase sigma-70 factor (ECF subfamily)
MRFTAPLPDEPALIDRASKGDNLALGNLVNHYLPSAYQTARRYVYDSDTAEDIVEDAFIAIVVARNRLDPDRNFGGLVYRTVFNKAMNYLKKKRREHDQVLAWGNPKAEVAELPDPSQSIEEATEYKWRLATVYKALATLPPKYQEVIYVRHICGESANQAAETIGISTSNVGARLSRALKMLQEALLHGN